MRVSRLNFEYYQSRLMPRATADSWSSRTVHWVNICFILELPSNRESDYLTPERDIPETFSEALHSVLYSSLCLSSGLNVSSVCRWVCLRSTQRSQSPCRWRPKPSSCAALSPIRTAVPPPSTCSPMSSSPSRAARRRVRVASQVGSVQISSSVCFADAWAHLEVSCDPHRK